MSETMKAVGMLLVRNATLHLAPLLPSPQDTLSLMP